MTRDFTGDETIRSPYKSRAPCDSGCGMEYDSTATTKVEHRGIRARSSDHGPSPDNWFGGHFGV